VIAGSGWDEHIPDQTENVDIKGYVPEDELVDLYKLAAVFYFPTFHEGFGLPVLEAMAAGCAVVASNVYSVPEVTNYAAILCDPHDTNAHVKAIERLLEDKNERRALSTRALERAGEFSWEKAAKATMNIYRELT
jgi:glycosyltransferase involved in cell wall biosynthesis